MSIRIFLSAVLLLSLINPISAAAGKYPADVREFAKAKEAVLESLEALNEKASYLEKITYALQIGRLHEESLRLMLDISDRKKLVSQGEYVAAEDLAVRTAALESDIYKAIESESIQHLNTNTGPEHQEISYPLEEALKKKELAALADALLAYRMGLQNTESAQQKRLEEFQKSLTWKHKYASLIVITVLSLSIISFILLQKSAKSKRDREVIEAFESQASSNPASLSRNLIEYPAVQKFLGKTISDEERRILFGE